jgi:hypothetical protein
VPQIVSACDALAGGEALAPASARQVDESIERIGNYHKK